MVENAIHEKKEKAACHMAIDDNALQILEQSLSWTP